MKKNKMTETKKLKLIKKFFIIAGTLSIVEVSIGLILFQNNYTGWFWIILIACMICWLANKQASELDCEINCPKRFRIEKRRNKK